MKKMNSLKSRIKMHKLKCDRDVNINNKECINTILCIFVIFFEILRMFSIIYQHYYIC